MATQVSQDLGVSPGRPPGSRFVGDALDRVRSSGEHLFAKPRRTQTPARRDGRAGALGRGLGWFSLGLGMVELAAPGVLERTLGLRSRYRLLLPALGVREIVAGFGILSARRPLPLWLWARVAGDVMDLVLVCVALTAERRAPRPPYSVAVRRPIADCRRLWHAFCASPLFRRDLRQLRSIDFEPDPAGRGTMIRVHMPRGTARAEHAAQEALRRFKQVVETGH